MAGSSSVFQEPGQSDPGLPMSRRVRGITKSALKEMPVLASKISGCLSLGQGVPSFATPAHIIAAACQALNTRPEAGKYSLSPGLPQLRQALAVYLREQRGLGVDPETELCVTVGAMEALQAAILALVDPGQEVIMPSPNYASHIEQVLLAQGQPVFVKLREKDWGLDPEALSRSITPKTKAIILSSPHNPTGAVFAEADLRSVAELALKHGLFIISDETYDSLVYDGPPFFSLTSLNELKDRLIAVFSFSKKYAMTGWRVGCLYAARPVLDQIIKVHDCGALCAPTVSQYAALAALEGPQDCVAEIRTALKRRRDLTCQRMERLGKFFDFVKPQGAFYLMARSKLRGLDSMSLALRILNEARVITIPGAAFGPDGENHLRLSFGGQEEEINQAFDRMETWLRANYG